MPHDKPHREPNPYAKWLASMKPDHTVHVTTKVRLSESAFREAIVGPFKRHLEKIAQGSVLFFYSMEMNAVEDRWHAHLVLFGCAHLSLSHIRWAWTLGSDRASAVYDADGATGYQTKRHHLHPDSYDIVGRMPDIVRPAHPKVQRPHIRRRNRFHRKIGGVEVVLVPRLLEDIPPPERRRRRPAVQP